MCEVRPAQALIGQCTKEVVSGLVVLLMTSEPASDVQGSVQIALVLVRVALDQEGDGFLLELGVAQEDLRLGGKGVIHGGQSPFLAHFTGGAVSAASGHLFELSIMRKSL